MSVHPPRRRSEERRDHVLDCALAVFAAKGYHAASIADVCARAGIARGTLYQYFKDKRDVLLALFDRVVQRVAEQVAAWPRYEPPPGPPDDAFALQLLEARCRALLDVVFQDEATARLVVRAALTVDGVIEEALRRIDAAVVNAVEHDIRLAVDAGRIRPCDPTLVARFVVGGIEKVVLAALDDGREVDRDHIVMEATRVVALGLLWRPLPGPTNDVAPPGGDDEEPA